MEYRKLLEDILKLWDTDESVGNRLSRLDRNERAKIIDEVYERRFDSRRDLSDVLGIPQSTLKDWEEYSRPFWSGTVIHYRNYEPWVDNLPMRAIRITRSMFDDSSEAELFLSEVEKRDISTKRVREISKTTTSPDEALEALGIEHEPSDEEAEEDVDRTSVVIEIPDALREKIEKVEGERDLEEFILTGLRLYMRVSGYL